MGCHVLISFWFNVIVHTHTPIQWPSVRDYPSTRKAKPIWILLKQETVSGNGISWAICKSAPHSRQITTPALHHSVFYRPDALPAAQPTASKHWKLFNVIVSNLKSAVCFMSVCAQNEANTYSTVALTFTTTTPTNSTISQPVSTSLPYSLPYCRNSLPTDFTLKSSYLNPNWFTKLCVLQVMPRSL